MTGDEHLLNWSYIDDGRILDPDHPEASTVVLKMTYHPNWRVAIDGREVRPFMVSPSFIGFAVPAGSHQVSAAYRSTTLKTVLLGLGGCALLAVVLLRRWLARLDALFPSKS